LLIAIDLKPQGDLNPVVVRLASAFFGCGFGCGFLAMQTNG